MDVCAECMGVWLDAGELQKILNFNRSSSGWDAVADAALSNGPDILDVAGNLASEATSTVFQFLGEALSSLDFF